MTAVKSCGLIAPAAFLEDVEEGAGEEEEPEVGAAVEGCNWVKGVVRPGAGVLTPATPQNEVENWIEVSTSA